MARPQLLTEEQWERLLAAPTDERELIRHCTLGHNDLDTIGAKRTARNRLGYALLLCYLRHPDRVPDPNKVPPPTLLAFVARQVGAEPGDYADYRRRGQTRREQIVDILERTKELWRNLGDDPIRRRPVRRIRRPQCRHGM